MKTLEQYREKIDALDDALIALLGKRYDIVRAVGRYKAGHGLAVVQSGRVDEVRERARVLASKHGLDPDFVLRLYDEMIDQAHILEEQIKQEQSRTRHGTG